MLKFIPLLLLIVKFFYGQMGPSFFISVACYIWIYIWLLQLLIFITWS